MLAQVTAFELLVLMLVVAVVVVLVGWAGGKGVALSPHFRLSRLEGVVERWVNTAKGQAGQAKTAETRSLQQQRMAEAEALINARRKVQPGIFPRDRDPTEAEMLAVAAKRGLISRGGGVS